MSAVVTGVHDVISIFAKPGCSKTQGIIRNSQLNIKLLSIISTSVKVNKLLPVLFLFAGFQAHAAPITTIGNLSYDGTIISGDGRTYIGLDTLAPLTYQQTLDKITSDALYDGYRLANTEDADYFISSLFGDTSDNCSTTDGVAHNQTLCGTLPGWSDGIFGDNYTSSYDRFFFIADESAHTDYAGEAGIHSAGGTVQNEAVSYFSGTDRYSTDGSKDIVMGWLLVKNSNASNAVPTPSSFAIFVLGLAGIGFARRRRS